MALSLFMISSCNLESVVSLSLLLSAVILNGQTVSKDEFPDSHVKYHKPGGLQHCNAEDKTCSVSNFEQFEERNIIMIIILNCSWEGCDQRL